MARLKVKWFVFSTTLFVVIMFLGCAFTGKTKTTKIPEQKPRQEKVVEETAAVPDTSIEVVGIENSTRELVLRFRWAEALKALERDKSIDSLDKIFLAGFLNFKLGMYDKAESLLSGIVASDYELSDWARYLCAQAAFKRGDYDFAYRLVRNLGKLPGISTEIATIRWKSLWEMGDTQKAIAQLDSAYYAGYMRRREHDVQMAFVLRNTYHEDAAERRLVALLRVADILRDKDIMYRAIAELKKIHPLDPVSMYYIALTYYKYRDVDSALPWFKKYRASGHRKYRGRAGYYIAVCLIGQGKYSEAIKYIEKMLKEGSYSKASLYWRQAQCWRKKGKLKKAWKISEKALKLCNGCGNEKYIIFERMNIARYMLDWQKFAGECERMLRKHPSSEFADNALLWATLVHLTSDQPEKAAKLIKKYRIYFREGNFIDELNYWLAKSYEAMDSSAKADSLYLYLAKEPYENLFIWLARQKMGWVEFPNISYTKVGTLAVDSVLKYACHIIGVNPESLCVNFEDARLKRQAERLTQLGILELARPCFHALEEKLIKSNNPRLLLSLWKYYYNLGLYDFATKEGTLLNYYLGARKNAAALMTAYPTPYFRIIDAFARQSNINPLLVYSIIRQESKFHNFAESYAGAIGLMQIIPETGHSIARRVGVNPFTKNHLNDYEINLKLGTNLIAELINSHGSLYKALAEYNAGNSQLSRWNQQCPNPQDDLVWTEFVDYGQTRRYIKKVVGNLFTYYWLYGRGD